MRKNILCGVQCNQILQNYRVFGLFLLRVYLAIEINFSPTLEQFFDIVQKGQIYKHLVTLAVFNYPFLVQDRRRCRNKHNLTSSKQVGGTLKTPKKVQMKSAK